MRRASPATASRELAAIGSSFLKVRILHYASASPATASAIAERLRRHNAPADPAKLLASMTYSRLLRAKAASGSKGRRGRHYALTPKGRRLLYSARKHLRQLAEKLLNQENAKTGII